MSATRTCPICGYSRSYRSTALADHNHPKHSCATHRRRLDAQQRRARREAGEPPRPCHHPRAAHQHGTRAAYVHDRCRCRACADANAAASTARTRERTYGRWSPFVDAEPLRQHIARLRAHGIGINRIAELAGLSPGHIRALIYARGHGTPPFRRVRAETADRLLRVQPDPTARAPRSQIPATGTRRRLQALVAIGWPVSWLAAELGREPNNLRRTLTSHSVTVATAQQVAALYDRTWNIPPTPQTRADRAAVAAARQTAARNHWLPPLAWDDIDTDPDPKPTEGTSDTTPDVLDEIAIERALAGDGIGLAQLTRAEQDEAVRRLTEHGRSLREIADLLATTTRTISRRRKALAAA